jgi:hypothetical protein
MTYQRESRFCKLVNVRVVFSVQKLERAAVHHIFLSPSRFKVVRHASDTLLNTRTLLTEDFDSRTSHASH